MSFMEQNTLKQNSEFNANRLLDLLRVTGKKYDLDKAYIKKCLKKNLIISAICVAVPLIFILIFGG